MIKHYAIHTGAVLYLLFCGLYLPAQVANAAPFKTMNFYQAKDNRITLQIKNEKLQVILDKIEKRSGYAFVYSNDEINTSQRASVNVKEKELADVLNELLTPLHIGFEIIKDKVILKAEKTGSPLAAGSSGYTPNP